MCMVVLLEQCYLSSMILHKPLEFLVARISVAHLGLGDCNRHPLFIRKRKLHHKKLKAWASIRIFDIPNPCHITIGKPPLAGLRKTVKTTKNCTQNIVGCFIASINSTASLEGEDKLECKSC